MLAINTVARSLAIVWTSTWLVGLVLATSSAVAFGWILHFELERLYGLTAPTWDLGQEQQLIWSLSQGKGWYSSVDGHNFLGIHFAPILLLVGLLEWVWAGPQVLLVLSAVALAGLAPAAFLFFRAVFLDRPGAIWLALALAAPMPFWAAVQSAAAFQFHPENLALPMALLAGWAGLTKRRFWLWLLALAVITCKEDQTYTVFLVGLLVWRVGPVDMQTQGKAVMVLAGLWLVVGVGMIQLAIRGVGPDSYSPDFAYYSWVLHPLRDFPGKSWLVGAPYLVLLGLLVSLLGLPLLAYRWLLLVVPALAANMLSNHLPQQELQLHYALLVIFPLLMAAGLGGRRWLEDERWARWSGRPGALLALALPALLVGFVFGQLPPAMGAKTWLYDRGNAANQLLSVTSVIPSDARVYADDGDLVWLANRSCVNNLQNPLQADRYVVLDRQSWQQELNWPSRERAMNAAQIQVRSEEMENWMLSTQRKLLVDDGRFQVWSPGVEMPGNKTGCGQ